IPGSRFAKVNVPAPVDSVVLEIPVARFVATMVAPGTTAPVESVTRPVIAPLPVSCANAEPVRISSKTATTQPPREYPIRFLMLAMQALWHFVRTRRFLFTNCLLESLLVIRLGLTANSPPAVVFTVISGLTTLGTGPVWLNHATFVNEE